MKYVITGHPINKPLQQQLGIYDSSYVKSNRVGSIMAAMIKDGKIHIHSYYDADQNAIKIHMSEHP